MPHPLDGPHEEAGTPPAVRVVLADHHHVVRTGVALLLRKAGIVVVAQAGDIAEALDAVRSTRPDVLVLELDLPDPATCLAALPALRDHCDHTSAIVLTGRDDPRDAQAALRAGALGYLHKDAADGELVAAVRRVARGLAYLDTALGARIAALVERGALPPDDLSSREAEVLSLIALGFTNAEIGLRLFLSVRTVETHRAHVQQKLGRATRAELVRYALDHGLMSEGIEDLEAQAAGYAR